MSSPSNWTAFEALDMSQGKQKNAEFTSFRIFAVMAMSAPISSSILCSDGLGRRIPPFSWRNAGRLRRESSFVTSSRRLGFCRRSLRAKARMRRDFSSSPSQGLEIN